MHTIRKDENGNWQVGYYLPTSYAHVVFASHKWTVVHTTVDMIEAVSLCRKLNGVS